MQRRETPVVRPAPAALTVAVSVATAVLAVHLPPFVVSGANLSDPAQADYASNLWSHTTPVLAAVAAIFPVLVIFAIWPPIMTGHRRAVLVVCILGLCTASLFALEGLNAYGQAPIPVNGKVTSFHDREISQCGFPSHHLVISYSDLRQTQTWVKPGVAVLLYLTPTGDAAYLGPAQEDWPCITSSLGQ
jgi:hypothetical protein